MTGQNRARARPSPFTVLPGSIRAGTKIAPEHFDLVAVRGYAAVFISTIGTMTSSFAMMKGQR
jgi:hypothetical protein